MCDRITSDERLLLRISGSPLKNEVMANEKSHLIKLPPSDAATRFVQRRER